MSNDVDQAGPVFKWNQNSLKFAVADLRRNWPRWLFWSGVFVGGTAALALIRKPTSHPQHPPPSPEVFWSVITVGAFGFQFLLALCVWEVEIGDGSVKLSSGRNSRYYDFEKIVHVAFLPVTASMLIECNSGKKVEVFLNESVQVDQLKRYFSSHGVSVVE
jgi:hypothetical protein